MASLQRFLQAFAQGYPTFGILCLYTRIEDDVSVEVDAPSSFVPDYLSYHLAQNIGQVSSYNSRLALAKTSIS